MYTFMFARNFNGLIQDDYDQAYLEVSTKYSGISTLWGILDEAIKQAKRDLCYQYLTAWYLADLYPAKVTGIDADGRPLTSKSIGGVSVSFSQQQGQDSLMELTSNTFGMKAKSMIESCPERMGIYG
jgi:hypothetical protein